MQKTFKCQDKPSSQIELELPGWLKENKSESKLFIEVGLDKNKKDLVLKEVEKVGLVGIEWHYSPGLIIIVAG